MDPAWRRAHGTVGMEARSVLGVRGRSVETSRAAVGEGETGKLESGFPSGLRVPRSCPPELACVVRVRALPRARRGFGFVSDGLCPPEFLLSVAVSGPPPTPTPRDSSDHPLQGPSPVLHTLLCAQLPKLLGDGGPPLEVPASPICRRQQPLSMWPPGEGVSKILTLTGDPSARQPPAYVYPAPPTHTHTGGPLSWDSPAASSASLRLEVPILLSLAGLPTSSLSPSIFLWGISPWPQSSFVFTMADSQPWHGTFPFARLLASGC